MNKIIKTTMAAALAVTVSSGGAFAKTVLTYSSWIPWTHPLNVNLYIPWMDDIEKDSEGRIEFKRLPKPVASPPAHLDAVRTRQIDVAFSVHGYSPELFAPYLFAENPMLGDTAVGTSIALQRTHEKFLSDCDCYAGVHVIGMNTHGPGVIHHTSKDILVPADMEGQKMRTGGPIPQAIVEAWGGVPIRQPAPKSYEILSTGVADGITFPYESLVSFNITDLVTHSTYIPGGLYSSSHYLVINQDVYDALSDEDKAVLDKHSGEAFAKRAGAAWDKINDEGLEAAKANGNTLNDASDEMIEAVKELTKGFESTYVENARGVDGQAILDFFKAQVVELSTTN